MSKILGEAFVPDPNPEDEQAPPEIRGGDRPSDYLDNLPVAHEDEELEDGAESQ